MPAASGYLVFDVGTTSVKTSVIDDRGALVAGVVEEYQLTTPGPDRVEVDPRRYWTAICTGIRRLMRDRMARADAQGAIPALAGIGVCSQGETVILLDRSGEPLCDAIVWMDNRATKEADCIRDKLGTDRRTGMTVVDPMWTATKLLWLRKHEPRLLDAAWKVMLVEDYVLYRLTGEAVSDYSLYPTSYLLDIYAKQWWTSALDLVGLHEGQLPRLVAPGTVIGTLTSSAAAELGVEEMIVARRGATARDAGTAIPVIAGGMDQTAAMVGAGNVGVGMVTETTGAALALCTTIGAGSVAAIREATSGALADLPIQPHIVPETYLTTQWCQSGGMSLKWLRDTMFANESEAARAAGRDTYEPVTAQASRVAPGADQLLFLPYMAGTGTIHVARDVRGVFWGLGLNHTRAHMARAVMESIAYLLRMLLEQIESAGLACTEIRLLGGGAKSELWRRIKADVTGRPVVAVDCPEVASLGVAMQVATAIGRFSSVESASAGMAAVSSAIEPDVVEHRRYEDPYRSFLELHARV